LTGLSLVKREGKELCLLKFSLQTLVYLQVSFVANKLLSRKLKLFTIYDLSKEKTSLIICRKKGMQRNRSEWWRSVKKVGKGYIDIRKRI